MRREIQLAYPDDRRRWFRRSSEDYYKLRWSIKIPLTLAFAAVWVVVGAPILLGVGKWLATALAIHQGEPVHDQPHGTAWLVAFLFALIPIMSIVAAVWCAMVTAWLVAARNWASTDAYNAIVLCRYPRHWIKPDAGPPG